MMLRPALKASGKVFYEVVKAIGVLAAILGLFLLVAVYGLVVEVAAGIVVVVVLIGFGTYLSETWLDEYRYQSRQERIKQDEQEQH